MLTFYPEIGVAYRQHASGGRMLYYIDRHGNRCSRRILTMTDVVAEHAFLLDRYRCIGQRPFMIPDHIFLPTSSKTKD